MFEIAERLRLLPSQSADENYEEPEIWPGSIREAAMCSIYPEQNEERKLAVLLFACACKSILVVLSTASLGASLTQI